MNVKRYRISSYSASLKEDVGGSLVYASDYDALLRENAQMREAMQHAYRLVGQISSVQLNDNDARKKVSDAYTHLSAGIRALNQGDKT